MPLEYKVIPFDKDGQVSTECDNFAFMHSFAYSDLIGASQKNRFTNDLYGYLRLSSGKRKIYLKYRAWNPVHKGEVMLSYINRCRLRVANSDKSKVQITKSCWFWYYWRHGDSGIRVPFKIAIFGLLLSIAGIILSIFL